MNSLLRFSVLTTVCLAGLAITVGFAGQPNMATPAATPTELVATYDNLATAILAVKNTEERLVRSILATTFGHANAALGRAQQAMQSNDAGAARAALEEVAAYVAQMGAEGDNAVAAIRKRLLEGGHHHHAAEEAEGVYDPGYVVVTKAAKRELLDASRAIGQLANAPDEAALTREWKRVTDTWNALAKQQ